jgi:hypothetical protein
MADAVTPTNVGEGLASVATRQGFLDLEWGELELASEFDPARHRSLAAIIGVATATM